MLVEDAGGVIAEHELLGLERLGELAATRSAALMLYASPSAPTPIGATTGMKVARIEELDDLGVDALDLADEPDVDDLAPGRLRLEEHLARVDERAVPSREGPTALPPCWLMRPDDLLVELPGPSPRRSSRCRRSRACPAGTRS